MNENMQIFCCVIFLAVLVNTGDGQIFRQKHVRNRFPVKAAINLKNRIQEKLSQYRERHTQSICYDKVGCFNLPHKNSPLQKIPENPKLLDTKFYLFTRHNDFAQPEILYYDDENSLDKSSFNVSNPLKLIAHGYMSTWNEKGSIIIAKAYLKMYDCNVVLMDWHVGARGPQYPTAAANTELVGRQLGILLAKFVEKGMDPRRMHLIGFSLGAHVCGTASETLKTKGYLLGRITGLDAASPLFKNNYFREKYKKLDRSDAKFVDVIHTDGSPFVTDGFGLWEPIGHVDFFPNGGQEQPGCDDIKDAIVVSHFERGLSKDLVCSHIRAFLLFRESVINLLEKQNQKKDKCEFVAYNCPGGMSSFEKGQCFPQLGRKNDTFYLDPSYRFDIGKFGEDAKGEGVMFFTTKDSSQYCGQQLKATIHVNFKTGPMNGILQLELLYYQKRIVFNINCEIFNYPAPIEQLNGLATADYNSLNSSLIDIPVRMNYLDIAQAERRNNNETLFEPTIIYFDRIVVTDMFGERWHYCKPNTKMEDTTGQQYGLLTITLSKTEC